MKRKTNFIWIAAVCSVVFLGGGQANATTLDTDWWSNADSFSGVYDPVGDESVRLADTFYTGYIEGQVDLPYSAAWRIDFYSHTDETWDVPAENIKITINSIEINTIYNTPVGNFEHDFSTSITGDSFTYRFDFSSPLNFYHAHMVMEPGCISDSEVPEPATMLLFGTGLAGVAGARLRRRTG